MRHSAPTEFSQAAPAFWRCLPAQDPSSPHLSNLGKQMQGERDTMIKQANGTNERFLKTAFKNIKITDKTNLNFNKKCFIIVNHLNLHSGS